MMKGRTLVLIIFCVNVNSASFSGRLFSLVSTSDKSASFETKKKMHNKRIRVLRFCLIAFWHFVWPILYTPVHCILRDNIGSDLDQSRVSLPINL